MLLAQVTMKCHLHIAEYIEWGIGYQIPFYKKGSRRSDDGIVFHHKKDWWK